jgi:hypothetical protein
MPKKRHKPEEIVSKLRQADVLISQGQDIANVIRQIGVSEGHLLSVALGVRQAEDRAGQAPEGAREGEYPSAQGDLRPDAGQTHLAGGRTGRLLSPSVAAPVSSKSVKSCMSPSVAPARRSGSTARHSARSRGAVMTKSGSPPT